MSEWGKDHWCTLAYIHVVCVNDKGVPDLRRMRCNPEINLQVALSQHRGDNEFAVGGAWDSKPYPYSTRLKRDPTKPDVERVEPGHDDWCCLLDMEREGLLLILGTGLHPWIKLEPKGRALAEALQRHKESGGWFRSFTPPEVV